MIANLLPIPGSPTLKFSLLSAFILSFSLAAAQTVDCSNNANCGDAYCSFAPNIEKGCNCFDGIDNDGDGKVDKADSNCATYYGLVFVGEDSDCSIIPPGANTPFALVNEPVASDQNTADTQSKVSVGDVDGDGIPDAVVTSKWNQEIRVIATASGQADGKKPGSVKSSFKTTGQGAKIFSGSGDCKPNSLLFEHENLIADIDGNGTSEIFGVVSNRGGNPSTPPTCFFLVGFTYKSGTLEPLYNAIQIGTDRPGTFGIADMDGDGKAEIYMRDRIYAAETGALLATGNGNWDLDITSGPVAVNVVGDDKMELVCGTKIYSIPNFSNRNPATPANLTLVADMNTITSNKAYVKLAIDDVEYGVDTHSMCSVADIDRDGNMDVVISGALNSVSGPTAVFYWNVAKGTVSHYVVTDPAYANGWPWGTGRVNLGDANGDGKTDMLFIAGSYLHALTTDASGNLVPLWPTPRTINDTRSGVLTVSIYDFNNDGDPEVVYRDSQELAVIDGATGQTKIWSAICQSHTYTEGPVIADVNGDGATDICVSCNTSKSFDIGDPIQQQALGQFRLYYSSGNDWLPTRKVWNQPGYFVVNVNDDLTLPFPQLDQNLVFGDGDCLNGLPGPQMPMNVFLNQVPNLAANGCPVFPAPDLSFIGDDPDTPGVDSNGDGVYTPTVEVFPPICGDLAISVRFNIVNDGDLPISANIPVSFFIGDPTDPSITSDSLIHSASLPLVNLQVDETYTSPLITFNGTGSAFRLYIVLNNDGTILPINPNGSVTNECRIDNNIYSAFIQPDPFETKIEKIKDNFKCENTAPDNGELRVRIFKAGVEVTDYSQYAFQWYTGTAASYSPIAGATNYNLTGLPEGDYTAIVTNTAKGCVGVPVDTTILREGNDPEVIINVISHQTVCSPPNGQLQAQITGGNTGYTFEWFDIALNPLGISGPTANNLVAGNYLVRVSKDGCSKNSLPQTVDGPVVPDAQAATLLHVEDCLNPNSGSVTATALFNGAPQDPANYSFEWYLYDNATMTRGSVLPAANGTGPTRTGLKVGHYQVVVKDLATQCAAVQTPITEVQSATIIPTALITELAPLTSCDAADPNGRFQASVEIGGVSQDPSGFTFEWFKGDNTLAANAHTDVSGVNGSIAESIAGGGVFYTVKVTTGNNCSDTEKLIVTEDINLPVVTLNTTDNGICDPALATSTYNGTVTASVTFDGVAVTDFTNYQVTWHDGSLTTSPVITGESAPFLDQRNGGFYTVLVERTDLSCVSAPVTAEVRNNLTLPVIGLDSIASTNCVVNYGGQTISNGEAFVTTVDGIAPNANHIFLWSDNGSPTDVDGLSGSIVQNVQGGFVYTVEVTNRLNGCKNTNSVTVPDNSVVPVVSLAVAQPNSICDPALTMPSVQFNGRIEASFLTPSGNAADYKYTWRNVTDNVNLGETPPMNGGQGVTQLYEFGGLNGNKDYSVIAENTELGCTSAAAQVYLPNDVALPVIKTDSIASTNCVVNYGGEMIANGQAFVASIDGAAPTANFTYLWSDNGSSTDVDGRTTQTITQIQGGFIYTVQVTNTLTGCRNTDIVPLADASVVPVVSLAVAQPNSICDPALTIPSVQFNGRIAASFLTPSGNTADYKYTWRNVTDNLNLGETPPMNGGQGVTQLYEFGGLNGNKDYSVIAENTELGCTSAAAQVYLPNDVALPVIKTDSIASTNCVVNYGGEMIANGQAFVASIDGAAPTADYTYLWSDNGSTTDVDGRTTQTITQIQGGFIYTVEVTNRLTGCRNTDIVPLTDASVVPVVSLTVAQPNSICDESLASLDYNGRVAATFLTPSGNAADYKYIWRNVTDNVNLGETPPLNGGQGVTQLFEFGGLNGNKDYSVIAENTELGCTSAAAQVYLPNDVILPVIKTDSIASTNCVVNYGGEMIANGQAFVASIDGAAPTADYTYLWSDNGSTTDVDGRTTQTITQIQGGFIYTVEVTNRLTGCRNTDIVPLADASVVPVVSLAVAQPNSICDESLASLDYNGRVVATFLTPSGNAADYKYIWRNVTDNTDLGETPPMNGGQGVTQLSEFGGLNGNRDYSVIAENTELGCTSAVAQVYLPNDVVLPLIKTDSIPSTNCVVNYGGSLIANGEVFVSSVDNAAPTADYVFLWSDNGSPTDANGRNTAAITQLQGGFIYTVQVTNTLTGCRNSRAVPLPDMSVVPVVSLSVDQPNTVCDETLAALTYNGRVAATFLTMSGNAANYQYNWHNVTDNLPLGTTPPNSTGPGVTLETQFGGLNGNKTYSVTAVNTLLGCTSGEAQIFLPNQFLLPRIVTDSIPSTNCVLNYNGNPVSNGEISITSVDGAAPLANYTFAWSDDGATPTPTTATTTVVTNLEGGHLYSVLVRNISTGCANTHTVNLTRDPVKPVITVSKTSDNVNCTGTPTGALEAVVSYRGVAQNTPGSLPLPAGYIVTWSTSANGDILSAQPAGNYTATVVNESLGCTSDPHGAIILDMFDYPAITLVTTDQTSCDTGAPNGALQATLTTTSGTLEYQWREDIGVSGSPIGGLVTGQLTGVVTSITNRESEDYTIVVRNEVTGCESIKSAFIPNNITYPTISLTNTNPVTICGPVPNGEARATIAGLSALPTESFDIFYVYTFTGGTAPTDPAIIKASTDPKNIVNGTGPFNPGVNPADYVDMAPGYLTALIVDNNTKCESNPTTVQIIDNTVENQIAVNGTSAAGFCGGIGGAIDVTVSGGVGAQNYAWFEGTPSNDPLNGNINFFNNPPDMSLAQAVLDDLGNAVAGVSNGVNEDLGPPSQPTLGVGAGTYTLIITDANGCGAYFVETVPFTAAPTITVTETDVTKCVAPFNGEITVDVVGGSAFGYTIEIFSGNGPTGTLLVPASGVLPSPASSSKTALANGQYYVQVTDQDPNNSPCPLGSVHELEQKTFGPQILFNQIVQNTSCDPNTSADGKVEVTAIADSQHNTATHPTDFAITAISPAPLGLAIPFNLPDDGTSSGLLNGFGPNAYTFTVTDNNSGCETSAVVNIPDQPVLPTIFNVAAFDDSHCAPLSNGLIEVTSVGVAGPEDPANYQFQWYGAADLSNPANLVYTDIGGGGTTGEMFDDNKPGWSMGLTPGAGHGNRTYYVRARRITGDGIGCFTQLEQKDVRDVHKTPDLTLTTFDNTSCLPGTGEGVIRAITDIDVDPRDAGVINGTYTYSWNPDPASGSPVAGIARNTAFDITSLVDGTYTVTAVNSVNGCATTSSAEIITNPLPITLLSYAKTDQLICNPDGSITVTEIQIDATNTTANVVYNYSTAPDLVTNFDFAWYDANNDGDNNPATYNTTPIQSSGADINDDILTTDGAVTAQPYPNMGEGTYYVIATRKPGLSPGAGCTTVPVRVEVGRDVNDPVITALTPFANTSCETATVEGRIELAVSTTSGVAAEANSTYSFAWTPSDLVGNPGGIGNANNIANATATSTMTLPQGYVAPPALGPAFKDDTYTITVTNDYSGCTVSGQAVITPQKFPITLISYTKQDQLICAADGNITVTQVTIDGTRSNLPTFNYNSAADLITNFDFKWFDANNDGDNNSGTFNDADVLEDGLSNPIVDVVLSEDALETSQPFPGMGAGSYYVVATRPSGMVPGAGCSTEPVLVSIEDKHINPVITALSPFANTSCDASIVEGRIELTVETNSGVAAESGSTYSYTWTQADPVGNPGGAGNANNVDNATATSLMTIPQGYVMPPALGPALKDDTYTITVRNDYSNCTTTGQAVITPQKFPVTLISFTKQDQLICNPDGAITVTQVTIDGSTSNLPVFNYSTPTDLTDNFDFKWFDSNNDSDNDPNTFDLAGATLLSGGAPITDVVLTDDGGLTSQPYADMGAGSYYVLATRKPGMSPGAGCTTLPVRVNIEDKHINPVITAMKPFANTSCDANIVEGRIELTVNTNSGVAAESNSTYSYTWTQADIVGNPGGAGNANNVDNATATSLMTIPQGYVMPPALGPALKDDTYTITVRNDYSNCTTTGQVVITPQKFPVTLISFTKQDQLICNPDGVITVTQVTIDGSTSNLPVFNYSTPTDLTDNFDFKWFDSNNDSDNDPNTFDVAGATLLSGGLPITDVVLSDDGGLTSQPYADMGAGSYYVLATRKPGMSPGAGCTTLPVRVNIEDKHINPVITAMKPFANTSCDANIVEGRIELTVNTNSGVAAESGSTYSYTWTQADLVGNPGGAGNANNVDNATATSLMTIPQGYVMPPALGPALKDDTYTITVRNDYSNCTTTGQVVITPKRYPITLISFTKEDQLICNPDGSVTVTAVTIDGSTSNLPVFNYTTPADLTTNFDFQWFDANNDGDNDPNTFDLAGTPLLSGGSPITDVILTDDAGLTTQPYGAMGAGSYYVLAKRKPGMSPGAGCLTEPVRVNVKDVHVDPVASFTFTPNSSCDPMDPNGQLIATAAERPSQHAAYQPGVDYTFAWTLNGGALPAVTAISGASPVSQLDNAYEGKYVLLVTNNDTGCEFTSGIEVNLDHNISLPNIITVDPFDPIDCLGSGSAEVTAISIGGGPPITGPQLGTDFQYEWYEGDFVPASQLATTTPLLGGLNPGRYFVRVQDLTTDCKSSPTEVVIIDEDIVYPVVTIRQTALQVRCVIDEGTAQLEARGDNQTDANPAYHFSWFNNLEATGAAFATSSTISNLMHGEYSVSVTNDATGCSASEIYVVKDDSETYMPELSLNTEGRIDCLNPDGSLLAREVGYDPNDLGYPYPSANYSASLYPGANADTSQPGTAMSFVPTFNRNWRQTGLDIGAYTVKITDNNTGCVTTGVIAVNDERVMPVVTIVEDNPLINCDPARANGQLSATADGGKVGGYTFDWFTGTTASGTVLSTNNKLIGVGMGEYTVQVTNEFTHCATDATGSISDGRLMPPVPTAVLVFDRTRCDYPDGWVAANVGGITFNYSFDWYDGASLKPVPDFNGINYQNRDIGIYTVTAMDEITGCVSAPTSVEVKDMRVIPQVIITTTASYCEELPGSTGGNGTAEMRLDPADVISDEVTWTLENDNTTVGIGSYLTNILPGFYQANVITSRGCEAMGIGEVKTEVFSYNLVSMNGDGKNDDFRIDCITRFPNNNVKIFNRAGVLVYEADNYDNDQVVFKGFGEKGVYAIGNQLPVGTYFYIIDKRDGSKPKSGYLELVR